jgi:hypothetical protein
MVPFQSQDRKLGLMGPFYALQRIAGLGEIRGMPFHPGGRGLLPAGLSMLELGIHTGVAAFLSTCWTLFYRQRLKAASEARRE